LKLKLEAQNDVTILIATETVAAQHIPVLKAGISKLLQSGKVAIVVDLSGADPIEPLLVPELNTFLQWGKGLCRYFQIVSNIPELSSIQDRTQAVKMIQTSPEFTKALDETLKNRFKILETEKTKLEQSLKKLGAANDTGLLQKENSRLKKRVKHLEIQIAHYLKVRTPPHDTKALKQTAESTFFVVETLLDQQTIMNPNET
jgi:hypothetical protein